MLGAPSITAPAPYGRIHRGVRVSASNAVWAQTVADKILAEPIGFTKLLHRLSGRAAQAVTAIAPRTRIQHVTRTGVDLGQSKSARLPGICSVPDHVIPGKRMVGRQEVAMICMLARASTFKATAMWLAVGCLLTPIVASTQARADAVGDCNQSLDPERVNDFETPGVISLASKRV